MYYVELLRAKRALTWYGGILIALVAIGLSLAFKDGPPAVQMSRDANPSIPLGWLLSGCAFAPILLAAFLAVSLDAEYKTTAITWTRPLGRLALAARFVAVDVLALLAAWLLTTAIALLALAVLGLVKYVTPISGGENVAAFIAAALGCAVMWYGLVVLLTVLFPGHGGRVAGASWAYVLIVPGLAAIPVPPLLHDVFAALNYLNPLAYLSTDGTDSSGFGGHLHIGTGNALFDGPIGLHALVMWAIGLVAIAIAIRIWASREVPA